jgi:aldehyde dehydrogenase (NAD+)
MRPQCDVLASACHYFAGLAETECGKWVPAGRPDMVSYTVREPIGVVAAITPWNSPLLILAWKLLPALAAGNAVVVKPSEVTPTSTLLFAELIVQAGFPRGVVNVVTGYGNPTGVALVSHPGVDKSPSRDRRRLAARSRTPPRNATPACSWSSAASRRTSFLPTRT